MKKDGISVVLPVRNGMPFLLDQISAVLSQEVFAPFELIVVENASTDGTAEYLQEVSALDARVSVISLDQPGAGRARNAGIAKATYDRIALCDADDRVHTGWLEAHRLGLQGRVFCGGSIVRGALNTSHEQRRWGIHELSEEVPVVTPFGGESPLSANASLYRQMWRECGGFDERIMIGGDESEFFARCGHHGWSLARVPDAVIDYRLVVGDLVVLRKSFRYGRSSERVYQTVMKRRSNRWRLFILWQVVSHIPKAAHPFGRYRALEAAGYEAGRLVGSYSAGLGCDPIHE